MPAVLEALRIEHLVLYLWTMHAIHHEHMKMLCSCESARCLKWPPLACGERTRDPEGQAEGCRKDAASRQGAHSPHCVHQGDVINQFQGVGLKQPYIWTGPESKYTFEHKWMGATWFAMHSLQSSTM